MNDPSHPIPTTRREFLGSGSAGLALLAFGRFAPSFLVQSTLTSAPTPEKDRRILVLVQLAGGNDGLNTVVPFEDDHYYRLRPTLGIPKSQVLAVSDRAGLHPSCTALHELLMAGKLGIVQNVGYPNPNRSHFRSTEIWETATALDTLGNSGWIGRFLDRACSRQPDSSRDADPSAIHMSDRLPRSFVSQRAHPSFGLPPNRQNRLENRESAALREKPRSEGGAANDPAASFLNPTTMDAPVAENRVQAILAAYRPEAPYPTTSFSRSLRSVAALISGGMSTRVYFVSLGGFDTHSNQAKQHSAVLKSLGDGLAAFQKDLEGKKLDQQVLTMTFSEFGRRPGENENGGTEHGTGAPLFIVGSSVKAPLFGTAPSLDLQTNQDLVFSTDFREVYATVLNRWMDCDASSVLSTDFKPLDLIRT